MSNMPKTGKPHLTQYQYLTNILKGEVFSEGGLFNWSSKFFMTFNSGGSHGKDSFTDPKKCLKSKTSALLMCLNLQKAKYCKKGLLMLAKLLWLNAASHLFIV